MVLCLESVHCAMGEAVPGGRLLRRRIGGALSSSAHPHGEAGGWGGWRA